MLRHIIRNGKVVYKLMQKTLEYYNYTVLLFYKALDKACNEGRGRGIRWARRIGSLELETRFS